MSTIIRIDRPNHLGLWSKHPLQIGGARTPKELLVGHGASTGRGGRGSRELLLLLVPAAPAAALGVDGGAATACSPDPWCSTCCSCCSCYCSYCCSSSAHPSLYVSSTLYPLPRPACLITSESIRHDPLLPLKQRYLGGTPIKIKNQWCCTAASR